MRTVLPCGTHRPLRAWDLVLRGERSLTRPPPKSITIFVSVKYHNMFIVGEERDQRRVTIRMIAASTTGHGKRIRVETAIGRYKAAIGRRLYARSFQAERTKVTILNRMFVAARQKSVPAMD